MDIHTETTQETPEGNKAKSPGRRTARDIAFGIQQTIACWLTDFIDPLISKWFQNRFGNHNHEVTHKHVWGGEFLGDSSAFFVFVAAKKLLRGPIDAVTVVAKKVLDPILTKMGKKSIRHWAAENDVSSGDARYAQHLEDYKNFQAENIVDTGIVATAATGLNVAFQKGLGNEQRWTTILASKIIGAVLTMGTMMGVRTVLPTTTKHLDDEMSDRYINPLIRFTQKLFGVKPEARHHHTHHNESKTPAGEAKLLSPVPSILNGAPLVEVALPPDKRAAMIRMLTDHAEGDKLAEEASFQRFIEREKKIVDKMAHLFNPDDKFVRVMAQKHFETISRLQGEGLMDKKTEVLQSTSLESMQSIAINRRDDLAALKKLLDDPAFIQEVRIALQNPEAIRNYRWMTPERKAKLVDSLLQAKPGERGEPAVHIFASAKGQMLEHRALAECFDENGDCTRAFVREMQNHLKDEDPQYIERIAKKYMFDRAEAATKTANAFSLEGEVVREAIERSEAIRRKFQPAPIARPEMAAIR